MRDRRSIILELVLVWAIILLTCVLVWTCIIQQGIFLYREAYLPILEILNALE